MTRHLPNILTCLNLITGGIACVLIIRGDYHLAIYFTLISAVFDFLDGFVARLLKVQSAIGKELDSLADMISFGLVPALYMFRTIEVQSTSEYLPFFALLIAAFSAIRLAKFNIDDRQSDQFIGLPTPANTIFITSLSFLPENWVMNVPTLLTITTISSLILVANIPMIALKFKKASWKGNQLRYLLILTIVILIGLFQLQALPFVIPVYIVFSVLGNFAMRENVE